MRILIATICGLLIACPAIAQQADSPSAVGLITALHQQLSEESNELTLSQARLYDAEQEIAKLQAMVDTLKKMPIPKGSDSH